MKYNRQVDKIYLTFDALHLKFLTVQFNKKSNNKQSKYNYNNI